MFWLLIYLQSIAGPIFSELALEFYQLLPLSECSENGKFAPSLGGPLAVRSTGIVESRQTENWERVADYLGYGLSRFE